MADLPSRRLSTSTVKDDLTASEWLAVLREILEMSGIKLIDIGDKYTKAVSANASTSTVTSALSPPLVPSSGGPPGRLNYRNCHVQIALSAYAALTQMMILQSSGLPTGSLTVENCSALTVEEREQVIQGLVEMVGIRLLRINDRFLGAAPIQKTTATDLDALLKAQPLETGLNWYVQLSDRTVLVSPGLPNPTIDLPSPVGLTPQEFRQTIEDCLKRHGIKFVRDGAKVVKILPEQ